MRKVLTSLKTEHILFILLMGVLIPLELFSARLAYETLGEITSFCYFIGVIGFNLGIIAAAFRRRAAAALGAIILALLVIPYQIILGGRLLRVQAEAARIVAYVFEQKLQNGRFPLDLAEYNYHDSSMKKYIQSYQLDESREQFTVYYRVGAESTSHWFSSKSGWGYYPD